MSVRYPQMKKVSTPDLLAARLGELGIELPFDETVTAGGPLARPLELSNGARRALSVANRFAVLPMEGWDATTDGHPTDLVRRRWGRFGASGCGLVWGEATAVRPDGRANPNQLIINDRTVDDMAALRALLAPGQVAGMQLTHSGRYSRPVDAPAPRTAYQHPLLDARVGANAASVFGDDELDELAGQYVAAAVLAHQAGFDFVDVKHCHGYLLHELLSARDRPGRYGGDLYGRTRFLRTVTEGIRAQAPALVVAVRLSVFDVSPFHPGPGGVGVAEGGPGEHRGFGGDATGLGMDLAETHELFDVFAGLGIGLVSTTAGSPYYNPHVQRPAFFPPSDGYQPPEDPLVGVARQIAATAELASRHPEVALVGGAYSYLQEWLPNVGQAVVASGGASMIGLGRMILSYPEMAADVLAGRDLNRGLVCRTFSDCTTAPRSGLVSGCFPLDPFYKEHPQRVELTAAKRTAKARQR